MSTLLPLLKDLDPQHIHLVTVFVHVFEAFMDYSNPDATLFRDLAGLDNTTTHLKLEIYHFEERVRKQSGESQSGSEGKYSKKMVL